MRYGQLPEPPLDPPDPCGTGQCNGECCGQDLDQPDPYDEWLERHVMVIPVTGDKDE